MWTPKTKEPKIKDALVLHSISNCVILQQKRVVMVGCWVSFYKFKKCLIHEKKTNILG